MVDDFKDIFEYILDETSSEEKPYEESRFGKVILSKGYPKLGWNDPNILKEYFETKTQSSSQSNNCQITKKFVNYRIIVYLCGSQNNIHFIKTKKCQHQKNKNT